VNVIFILIAVSLLVAIGFLILFIWSIRAGQFEDEYTPSVRILFDDETNVLEEKTEDRSQKSEVRSQKSEVRSQKTEDRKKQI
jgi:cbb3-type cytochrome oxidase maturation protein